MNQPAQAPAQLLPVGDTAFTLHVDAAPGPALSAHLRAVGEAMAAAEGVLDTVQSFQTLTVFHAPLADRAALEAMALAQMGQAEAADRPGAFWRVQARFDAEAGPDQAEAAAALGLSTNALIEALLAEAWPVLAVGFVAGLPFMGPLPDTLKLPRRPAPRLRVPAGSVAIANGFCGIYPWVTPGGWHILGRTEFRLFDAQANPPAKLAPGDRVQFEAIS